MRFYLQATEADAAQDNPYFKVLSYISVGTPVALCSDLSSIKHRNNMFNVIVLQ